jgi:uncharacterized protein YjbJ (UPF0337 family)
VIFSWQRAAAVTNIGAFRRNPATARTFTNARKNTKGEPMDWNRVEGNWKQMKGKVKEQWGKLTDDDLDVINGKREQLEGKIQERYGYEKDRTKKDIDDWYGRQGR